jgi:hypothetical protein
VADWELQAVLGDQVLRRGLVVNRECDYRGLDIGKAVTLRELVAGIEQRVGESSSACIPAVRSDGSSPTTLPE